MKGRESVVMMSGPEGGGSGAKTAATTAGEAGGGGGAKESPSSTPSPSPSQSPSPSSSSTPSPSPPAAAPAEVGGGIGGAGVHAAAPMPCLATGVGVGVGSGIYEELARKKRGRPKKYAPDEMAMEMEMEIEMEMETEAEMGMGLALSPSSAPSSFALVHHSSHLSAKRSRGRPRGSGRRQLLATLGEWFAFSAGGSFTPHVVTIATGEDVAARILSFSQKGPRAICILSANGAISNVTLRQPGSSGGTLTYQIYCRKKLSDEMEKQLIAYIEYLSLQVSFYKKGLSRGLAVKTTKLKGLAVKAKKAILWLKDYLGDQ